MTLNILRITTQPFRNEAVDVSSLKFMVGNEELSGVEKVMLGTPEEPYLDSNSGFVRVTLTCCVEFNHE